MENVKSKKYTKLKVIGLYTLVYVTLSVMVWGWFEVQGKSLVNMTDAFEQHIKALIEYGKWMRAYIYHIINDHSFSMQNYSFGIGYGADFYSSMQYYCIGDILNLPVAFISSEMVYYYYQFLIILRPYLAGVFLYLFVSFKNRNKEISTVAAVTGMITYAFSGTVMFIGMWNPFFVNPMIYLPFMLLGVERLLSGRKPAVFIISVFLAACSNFYFFYMLVIITLGYGIIRMFSLYGISNMKSIGIKILHFIGYGIVGLLMSMVVFLPVVLMFLGNPRGSSGHDFLLLYDAQYYKQLLQNLISYIYHPDYDTELGFTFIAIPIIAMLCMKIKRRKEDFIMFAILLLMLILPFAGYAMTGFAYMINRWCWAIALLIGTLIIELWEDIFNMSVKELLIMSGACIAAFVLELLCGNLEYENVKMQLIMLAFFVILIGVSSLIKKPKVFYVPVLITVMTGIAINGYYANSQDQGNLPNGYVDKCTGEEFLAQQNDSEVTIVEQVAGDAKDSFYRYSGRNLIWNASLFDGISSTQFYWSLSNGSISEFFKDMNLNEMADFSYFGLDDRTFLMALTGVKYYSLRYDNDYERQFIPYGFAYNQNVFNFAEFENTLALPLGYTYSSVIDKGMYDEMTSVMKQQALLQGVVTEDEELLGAYPYTDPVYSHIEIPYTVELEKKVKDKGNNTLKVKKAGSKMTVSFEGQPASESYLYIEGLDFEGEYDAVNIEVTAYSGENAKTTKTISFKTLESEFYSGWHDYIVNMGYSQDSISKIEITFPEKGTYSYTDMKVVCQGMENIEARIVDLKQESLENVDLHKNPISYMTNEITGTITNATDKILLFNIPYQDGWTAYVDGKKVSLSKANTMFMAISLPAGEHDIRLTYNTPGIVLGLILSVIGFISLISICIYEKKKAYIK